MKRITEEMNIQKEWFKEAREQTVKTLPKFIKKLTEEYEHDYGTICHAIVAAAIGAARAVDNSPTGGITGFQAGCIMWGFIRQWMYSHGDNPLRLINYEDFLYPQYEERHKKIIDKSTWEWIQKNAREKMKEIPDAHENVLAHWVSIVNGVVPFGYVVKEC